MPDINILLVSSCAYHFNTQVDYAVSAGPAWKNILLLFRQYASSAMSH